MARLRFAPSPTGWLHLGNARTALVNWLFARRHGGTFLLRIDDTDLARSEERYVEAIRHDLRWLGLRWDEEHRQSARGQSYAAAFERLVAAGAIYPCTESPQNLQAWRAGRAERGLQARRLPARRRPRLLAVRSRQPPDRLRRPRPGSARGRSGQPFRHGGASRRRQLHLPVRLGGRRCRPRRQPHHPRRRPRDQHRRRSSP